MFEGVYTAIVTPFRDDGEVDYESLGRLIEWQISSGVAGIVPCGTTGESATLSEAEHAEVITFVVERVDKRAAVIAGTGSNCTKTAVELTRRAEKAGADGALVISPYYNKPTPEGIYRHFLEISGSTSLPIVIYNVPGRTGSNIPPEVVERLSALENVTAVKEASGNLAQVSRMAANTDLDILSGDDGLTLPILSVGGRGVISVAGNVAPAWMSELTKSYLAGDVRRALAVHQKLRPLFEALFIETNPIPVKTALAEMGKINLYFRLPLVKMAESNRKELLKVLKELSLI